MTKEANVFTSVGSDAKEQTKKPLAYGLMTKEQFDAEMEKGMKEIKEGRTFSADEVETELRQELGI